MPLMLRSSAFESGQTIPTKYTCDGQNVSPPLQWTGAPDDTQSFALICDDPDAPRGTFTHWVLYNLPPDANGLTEGDDSGGGMLGRTSFGKAAYGGPCPPRGPAHRYYFRLYALSEEVDMSEGATRDQVFNRIQPLILDQAELMGTYSRA